MRRNDTVEYDERAYMTETHGCKVTVRFRKKCDKELAKNTIAPLMNCFEEKQAARIA